MSQQLERLLPVLAAIPGVNIPAAFFQSAYVAASQRKIEQLEQALRYQVGLLNQKIEAGKLRLDHEYVRSESFTANVIQTLRAAEIADSEDKLKFIAQALLGCTTSLPHKNINKSLCMRIVEQITTEEMEFIVNVTRDGKFKRRIGDLMGSVPFVETDDNTVIARGLIQLGLLASYSGYDQAIHLQPSILAEHLILLAGQTTS